MLLKSFDRICELQEKIWQQSRRQGLASSTRLFKFQAALKRLQKHKHKADMRRARVCQSDEDRILNYRSSMLEIGKVKQGTGAAGEMVNDASLHECLFGSQETVATQGAQTDSTDLLLILIGK